MSTEETGQDPLSDYISKSKQGQVNAKKEAEKAEAKEKAAPKYEPLTNFKVKTVHTVKGGENLSMISEKYYKTQANWILIYRANMDVIGDNPNVIQPGMELKIPAA